MTTDVDVVNTLSHFQPMPRAQTPYHHGDLRAALLSEAAVMIAEGGVDALTMRVIGERLGVSRSAPYRHFADKDALLVGVAIIGFERLTERLAAIGSTSGRPSLERLRKMGETYVRFSMENPSHYRLMYGREALVREDKPELRQAADALFGHFVEVIHEHQKSGLLKRQDPQLQAYTAWGAMHGMASLFMEGQIHSPIEMERMVRHATSTLLDGLRPR